MGKKHFWGGYTGLRQAEILHLCRTHVFSEYKLQKSNASEQHEVSFQETSPYPRKHTQKCPSVIGSSQKAFSQFHHVEVTSE